MNRNGSSWAKLIFLFVKNMRKSATMLLILLFAFSSLATTPQVIATVQNPSLVSSKTDNPSVALQNPTVLSLALDSRDNPHMSNYDKTNGDLKFASLEIETPVFALSGVTGWYWTSNTTINGLVVRDVDGDGQRETVTGGTFYDGTRNVAQLVVWNSSSLTPEQLTTWYWTSNTTISSVAVGDINGDRQNEIVTGGYYFDGTRQVAQLVVWNSSSLAVEKIKTWYWTGSTVINSVALGDVDSDGQVEIVTGGFYNDGARNVAQLVVWNGSSLAVDRLTSWYWTGNTVINSVALGDVDGDSQEEIVTGGSYFDGTRNVAQLVEWNGLNLTVDRLTGWYWTNSTVINSVAIGDVDNDGQREIVTGGNYNDSTRNVAQLVVWVGSSLAIDKLTGWYWTGDTTINSVVLSDVDGDGYVEVVTGGSYFDGTRSNAQLVVWSGSDLAVENTKSWFWTSDTAINSVAAAHFNGDFSADVVTGGAYYDGTRVNAQLTVWGVVQNYVPTYKVYGLDFSPYTQDGQDPYVETNISEAQIKELLTTVRPYTNWVRTFGCTNGLEVVGRVAHESGLKAAVEGWIGPDLIINNKTISDLIGIGKAGEADMLIVGSEALLRGDVTETQLIEYINRVRAAVPGIPVATSDVYGELLAHPAVVAAGDVVLPNIYPYWEGVNLTYATAVVNVRYNEMVSAAGGKPVIVSESGWPSSGNQVGDAVPSPENAAFFFLNFVSWTRVMNVPFFYFAAFDEPWKIRNEGPQGAHWGVWDKDENLKVGMKDVFDNKTINDNWSGNELVGGPGNATIEFTYVPPYGSFNNLKGQVLHVKPANYTAAVYIKVGGGWWTKPYYSDPLTFINPDGSWVCDVTTGGNDQTATEFVAYLLPVGFNPPLSGGQSTLPAELEQNAAAKCQITRTP